MKRILVLAITAAFLSTPALAETFKADQADMLKQISTEMQKAKGDAAKLQKLVKQKKCVEEAKDVKGLAACMDDEAAQKK